MITQNETTNDIFHQFETTPLPGNPVHKKQKVEEEHHKPLIT